MQWLIKTLVGTTNADRKQEDIPFGSMGREGHESLQGAISVPSFYYVFRFVRMTADKGWVFVALLLWDRYGWV